MRARRGSKPPRKWYAGTRRLTCEQCEWPTALEWDLTARQLRAAAGDHSRDNPGHVVTEI